ncbi:MAG: HlyD family efflux transporter periplasmic adaptor subunit [Clostridia bacterium]
MNKNEQAVMPKRRKKRKKWPWILVVVLLAAIAGLYFAARGQVSAMATEEKAEQRDLTTYYSFSGNLTPVTDEIQTAKDSIKVKELYVKEGDVVETGAPLLRATDGTRIYADYAGTIEELFLVVDDQLQPGSQIAHIVEYRELEVSVDVDEYDISAITIGKEGTVYLNALDRTITGTVSEIARDAITDGGVSYFAVKMRVDAGDDVRSGMSVEVNMLNKEARGVVSLSLNTISYDEFNQPYVRVKSAEGKLSMRAIETGMSDGKYMEVLSGLAAGESVYYNANNMARFYEMQQEMMQTRSAMMGSK